MFGETKEKKDRRFLGLWNHKPRVCDTGLIGNPQATLGAWMQVGGSRDYRLRRQA